MGWLQTLRTFQKTVDILSFNFRHHCLSSWTFGFNSTHTQKEYKKHNSTPSSNNFMLKQLNYVTLPKISDIFLIYYAVCLLRENHSGGILCKHRTICAWIGYGRNWNGWWFRKENKQFVTNSIGNYTMNLNSKVNGCEKHSREKPTKHTKSRHVPLFWIVWLRTWKQ